MTESLAAPRISIIIPAYKSARYLAQTLDSVEAQTFRDWECIVVDDGSPDDGAAIAQSYADRDPRFRLLRKQNDGVAAARNTGYAAAHPDAEYVVFQDSDDVWEPEALSVLSATLDAHPEAAGAHGLAERMGPNGEELALGHAQFMRDRDGFDGRRSVPVPLDSPTTLDCLVTKFRMYPPGVVLVRRPLIARAGLWTVDRFLATSADWDMFARVARFGPFLFVDRLIAGYRTHDGSMTAHNNQWQHYMRRQAVLRRLVGSRDTTPVQARLVRRAARAWGYEIYAGKWRAIWTSLRQGHWRYTWAHFTECLFFFRATVASDLDLRLHRLLGFLRRGTPPAR